MNKFYELLNKLCPQGVPYDTLGNLVGVNRGKRLTKSQLSDQFEYEVYHGSKDTILGKYSSYNAPANTTIVVNTGGIGGVKYIDKPFWCSDGSFWLGHSKKINDKYLYYSIAGYEDYFLSKKRAGGVPTIDREVVEEFRIPVPPLEIQCEIVRILDVFSELITTLTSELEARRKQYSFYRNEFLSFNKDIKVEKMGNLITFINGKAYKQEELLSHGKYRVLRVGNFYSNNSWYYSDLELEDDKYCNKGDLLYCWAASLGPQIWDGDKTIFHYHIWKLSFDEKILNKRYLYHFLLKDIDDISSSLTHSTMPHVSMSSMNERLIPVPSLDEQIRIACILDNFEFLCNDKIKGIPAEIEARQKQYEYYRDKLLTFKELKA